MTAGPQQPVWWLAICLECRPVLPQPFAGDPRGQHDRDQWASTHNQNTGHLVLLARQDTATGEEIATRLGDILRGGRVAS